jgi:acyl dehydratase
MFLDEFRIGDRTLIGSHTFTAEDIMTFARAYDPQPFHIDEEAARASHFGGLIASGWQTAAIWMRLNLAYMGELAAERAARGEPMGRLGPSPGFKDMKWIKPVRAGDTLTYGVEVVDARPSASRPGWGVLTHRAFAHNQHGEEVYSCLGTVMVEVRPA